MQIPLSTSSLLVIDIQNDFCAFGYAFDRSGRDLTPIRTMLHERLFPFLERARSARLKTIFVAAHYPPRKFAADGFVELCVEGTPGAALYGIRPFLESGTETVLFKSEYDAFSNPELHELLQAQGVNRVLVSGVTTPSCVKATVLGALARGYRTILLTDLVAAAAHRSHAHEQVLDLFRLQDKVDVVASNEIDFA